jgi:hypothetical protein
MTPHPGLDVNRVHFRNGTPGFEDVAGKRSQKMGDSNHIEGGTDIERMNIYSMNSKPYW